MFKTKAINIQNPLLPNYLTTFECYICSLEFFVSCMHMVEILCDGVLLSIPSQLHIP